MTSTINMYAIFLILPTNIQTIYKIICTYFWIIAKELVKLHRKNKKVVTVTLITEYLLTKKQ